MNSEKGDSLVDIITKLSAKNKRLEMIKSPHYHTLFSTNILTEAFILKSFQRAFMNHHLKGIKSLDFKNNLFYTDYDGYKVAGYFEIDKADPNHYHIKTFFPDLSWYYRIRFTHQKEEALRIERFLKYRPRQDAQAGNSAPSFWVQHGIRKEKLWAFMPETWPRPLAALSMEAGNSQIFTIDEFILQEKIDDLLMEKLSSDPLRIEDNFQFFFEDKVSPTNQEVNNLTVLFKFLTHEFNIKFAAKSRPKSRLAKVKNQLQKEYFAQGIMYKFIYLIGVKGSFNA